jgi:hypothetical protein
VGRQLAELGAVQRDASPGQADDADDGAQRCRLARAEQAEDLPAGHLQRDVSQDVRLAVNG